MSEVGWETSWWKGGDRSLRKLSMRLRDSGVRDARRVVTSAVRDQSWTRMRAL